MTTPSDDNVWHEIERLRAKLVEAKDAAMGWMDRAEKAERERDKLRARLLWTEGNPGATHYPGCFAEHRACAMAEIERLRTNVADLLAAIEVERELTHRYLTRAEQAKRERDELREQFRGVHIMTGRDGVWITFRGNDGKSFTWQPAQEFAELDGLRKEALRSWLIDRQIAYNTTPGSAATNGERK